MSEAFIAFVRSEDQVLLMQRSDEIGDLPGAWDGIYGAGDPSDLDSIANRIEELYHDEEQRIRLGESAKSWVEENRTWATVIEGISSLYEELIKQK